MHINSNSRRALVLAAIFAATPAIANAAEVEATPATGPETTATAIEATAPVTETTASIAAPATATAAPDTKAAPRPIDPAQTAALLKALKGKNWDGVRAAAEAGADVNAVDKGGVSVLMLASAAGQADVVHLLLERGANANAVDKKGSFVLHYAIPEGNKPKKKKFGFGKMLGMAGSLAGGMGGLGGGMGGLAGNVLTSSLLGTMPLDSLLGGNLTSLLSAPSFSLGGQSAWMAIAGTALQGDMGGQLGVASLLGGGNLSSINAGGWTSLLSSVNSANPQVLSAMSRIGADSGNPLLWSQFLSTAAAGNTAGVEEMMKNPELSAMLNQASSGLSSAANTLPGNASRNIINDLVQHGAQLNAVNRDGKTAAQIARERGLTSLVPTLGGKAEAAAAPDKATESDDTDSEAGEE